MTFKNLKTYLFALALMTGPAGAGEVEKQLRTMLKKMDVHVESIRSTPIQGLYEVQIAGKILYFSKDGKYLVAGSMIDMQTKENLTEQRLGGIRAKAISTVKADQLISFTSKKPKHTVTVFTDIDCGYCRKLHSEMAEYNKQGISVNYLFYPRAGIGSPSYQSSVSVWCSKNRNDALTQAKLGKKLSPAKCNNPVARHFELGNTMEISGTPAIVTKSGVLLPGYVPPDRLKRHLDQLEAQAATGQQVSRK